MTTALNSPHAGHNTTSVLTGCASRIKTLIGQAQQAAGNSLLLGVDIGRAFEEARKVIGVGGALFAWAERYAGVKQRQAKTYLSLAKNEEAIRAAVAWSRTPGIDVDPKLLRLENAGKLVAAHLRATTPRSASEATEASDGSARKKVGKKLQALLTLAAHRRWIETLEATLIEGGLHLPQEDAEQRRLRDLADAALRELPVLLAEQEHHVALEPSEEGTDGATDESDIPIQARKGDADPAGLIAPSANGGAPPPINATKKRKGRAKNVGQSPRRDLALVAKAARTQRKSNSVVA